MAQHVWSVLCARALVEHQTQSVTLVDVRESYTLTPEFSLPEDALHYFPFDSHLVTYWLRSDLDVPEPEPIECNIDVVTPDGKSGAGQNPLLINLRDVKRFKLIFRMEMMPFTVSGFYYFVVKARTGLNREWQEAARVPLELIMAPPLKPGQP